MQPTNGDFPSNYDEFSILSKKPDEIICTLSGIIICLIVDLFS